MSEYTKQANAFLKKTGTKALIDFLEQGKHFDDDKEERDIYRVTLKRNGKTFTFKFGQSIKGTEAGEAPTAYDVLSCLTKYDPGTFENFCGDFGYDTDSRKAEKIYKAVVNEFKSVDRLFSDVIDELSEIA